MTACLKSKYEDAMPDLFYAKVAHSHCEMKILCVENGVKVNVEEILKHESWGAKITWPEQFNAIN